MIIIMQPSELDAGVVHVLFWVVYTRILVHY